MKSDHTKPTRKSGNALEDEIRRLVIAGKLATADHLARQIERDPGRRRKWLEGMR